MPDKIKKTKSGLHPELLKARMFSLLPLEKTPVMTRENGQEKEPAGNRDASFSETKL